MTAWRAELAQLTAAGVKPRYPWSDWFRGGEVHLVQGLDYHVTTLGLQSQANAAGKRMGLDVRTKTTESGCVIVALREHREAS